jgi:hypothetical protein
MTAVSSGIPSSMPQVIQPPGGLAPKPGNTTLIHIGFDYGLNYDFVANNADASEQIFTFLPQGIAYGLGIDLSTITMHSLQPLDTSATLGYITTLAMAFIPSEQLDALTQALNDASSPLYNNPNDSVKTLMSLIDPMVPLLATDGLDGANPGSPTATASGMGPGATANAAPISDSVVLQSGVKTASAAIGVGVVAGAAAYGAAMFFIAHRYRRNKRSHRRASSVQEGAAAATAQWFGGPGSIQQQQYMSEPDPRHETWFSRGSGHSSNMRSVREAGISAPVATDNSLGWR